MTTTSQHHLDRFFSGSIEHKLMTMETLYAQSGKQLLADDAVTSSLALLLEYEETLSGQMRDMAMAKLCRGCASREGGGCCSSYMEANSDVILLLINRLHGATVSRQHSRMEECCFLGSQGCVLPIKPMFCLNYNCSHIQEQATSVARDKLEQLTGRILTEQTRLETILLQKI